MSLNFYWQDKPISFVDGESIGYAIFRQTANKTILGLSPINQEYSLFCGIGACQGCLVFIEGQGITEACMTKASVNLKVRAITEHDRINLSSSEYYNE